MKITKYYCDSCNKEAEVINYELSLLNIDKNWLSYKNNFKAELCKDCTNKLSNEIKEVLKKYNL